ncbi:hypothetical protein ACI77O_12545 [Pseudomonas tritici]|uniref:hypothetical protein n=1 Tax=Pseudomonas tritici TaxID=2745518 RepID=UPI00387B6B43
MSEQVMIEREHLQTLLDSALLVASTEVLQPPHIQAAQQVLASPTSLRDQPSLDERREFFEAACKASRTYNFPLGVMVVNGHFRNYFDSDTDSAFAGYRAGFSHGRRWERGVQVVSPPQIVPIEFQQVDTSIPIP